MNRTIEDLDNQKIQMIVPEVMIEAEKNYEAQKSLYKKLKKACIDIVDSFCENSEMQRQEFFVCSYHILY